MTVTPSAATNGDPHVWDDVLSQVTDLLTAVDRDVYDYSKTTTLPIAGAIVDAYVKSEIKPPWYIDLLNINLDNADFEIARERIGMYLQALTKDGTRITKNLDFD